MEAEFVCFYSGFPLPPLPRLELSSGPQVLRGASQPERVNKRGSSLIH